MAPERRTDEQLVAGFSGSLKIYRLGKNRRKSHMFLETTQRKRGHTWNFNLKVSFETDYEINPEWVIHISV